MESHKLIPDCRTARSSVVYKAMKTIAQNPTCELSKKFISNRIKYPQQDLKQDEAIRQLVLSVEDRTLAMNGIQFEFTQHTFEQSDHDWYCYRCHDAGQVYKCNGCWRVYHQNCARFVAGDRCVACHMTSRPSTLNSAGQPLNPKVISQELKPIMAKLHEDVKQIPPISCFDADFYNSVPLKEMRKLVYNWKVSFASVERKINNAEYTTFDQFLVDMEDMAHNLVVVYGPKSRVAKFASQMMEISNLEGQMLSECVSCAKNFLNLTPEATFFNQPCDPPHQIVFARFHGFPHWPGKVFGQDDQNFQIWFFGGHFTKCYVEKKAICSIEVALNALRTQPFVNKGIKAFRQAIADYDEYMDKIGRQQDKLADSIQAETLSGKYEPEGKVKEELDGQEQSSVRAPTLFLETMSDNPKAMGAHQNGSSTNGLPATINGNGSMTSSSPHVTRTNGTLNNGMMTTSATIATATTTTNNNNNNNLAGNTVNGVKTREASSAQLNSSSVTSAKSKLVSSSLDNSNLNNSIADSVSNMSFTFNGDSMNSLSNSEENHNILLSKLDKLDKTPSSPRLSIKLKSGKKRDRKEAVLDIDTIKDENLRLKKRLKEAEDKINQMKHDYRDCFTKDHVNNLQQEYKQMLTDVKKKTWCWVCGEEAVYYCCFRNFYCSSDCQLKHWWSEHRQNCFRKKPKKHSA